MTPARPAKYMTAAAPAAALPLTRERLIVRHVLLPIACRTPSSKGSKARSCLVASQAPKESVWNCDLLCDQQLPIQTCSTGNGWV